MADQPSEIASTAKEAVEATTSGTQDLKGKGIAEDVPDPDEDDLDDLDDMLDDFSAVKLHLQKSEETPSQTQANAPAKAGPAGTEDELDELSEDEFARELQKGMADLLGDVGNSPELQAQFESIFKELGAAAAAGAEPSAAAPGHAGTGGTGTSFQDNIRRTMERMQASGDSATAAATADSNTPDTFMTELLKQMQGDGEGGEEEFSKMLLGMMEQLTNKEILYEPMKELNEKFPAWMEKNRGTVPADDLKRYEEQRGLVAEIVAKFEEKTYSDSDAADREYIVDRMQKMQAAGSPPADLVGDMQSAQEALGVPDEEACAPQ